MVSDYKKWTLKHLFKYIARKDVQEGSAPGGINLQIDLILEKIKGRKGSPLCYEEWQKFLAIIKSEKLRDNESIQEIRLLIHERLIEELREQMVMAGVH